GLFRSSLKTDQFRVTYKRRTLRLRCSYNKMVDHSGALSNPLVKNEGLLRKAYELYHKILSRGKTRPVEPKTVPKRPGEVAKTIYQVLSESDRGMRCKDIQLACEARLGRPVGWSNVKQCLSANSKGP